MAKSKIKKYYDNLAGQVKSYLDTYANKTIDDAINFVANINHLPNSDVDELRNRIGNKPSFNKYDNQQNTKYQS